ncbi:MAG: hypothetical protein ACE5MM_10135, partial [Nitrospiraceae bacterium]
ATQSAPNILVLDASTRSLTKGWFRSWLKDRLGCRVSVYRVVDGSRVKSLNRFDLLIISGSPASSSTRSNMPQSESKTTIDKGLSCSS